MFAIAQIRLYQFRNYESASFTFQKQVTGICGANGSGKTNLLDAVYYLAFTKSYFNKPDAANVQYGQKGMRIDGDFSWQEQTPKITAIIRENNRKEFLLNDVPYQRFSEHLGKFPCVMVAPDDVELITGNSDERRRWLDMLLSQLSPLYLQHLIYYNKVLAQRNGLLKQYVQSGQLNNDLLVVYNEEMCKSAAIIYEERNRFCKEVLPQIMQEYALIAGTTDDGLQIAYHSQLHTQNLETLLTSSLAKDCALGRTTAGVHRDDLHFQLHDYPFKANASQGQRKSLLFALKLCEWQVLEQNKGFAPILLLDDVFEKLDANRMHNLLAKVISHKNAQVIISDTHFERLHQHLSTLEADFEILEV